MNVTQFFDENEHPTLVQRASATIFMQALHKVTTWGIGGGRTWFLNRLIRYIKRIDPHVEDLDEVV